MLKKLFYLFILVNSLNAFAGFTQCGKYSAQGIIKRIDKDMLLIINPSSAIEYKLSINETEWPQVVPYIDKNVKAIISLNSSLEGYKGLITSLMKVETIIPNPLKNNLEDQLNILEKGECKK